MNWEKLKEKLINSEYHYFHTDNGVLLCGDCLEVMREIPEADLCLTSPPFIDNEVSEEYYTWLGKWLEVVKQKVKVLLMFNSSLRLTEIARRWNWRFVLIWYKPFTLTAYKYEPIFLWTEDPTQKIWGQGRIYRTVLSHNIPKIKAHINENPVELYEELLKFFQESKVILDPFIGSGTTAVACERLNRKWVGIEISEKYCEIAQERILKRDRRQLTLD